MKICSSVTDQMMIINYDEENNKSYCFLLYGNGLMTKINNIDSFIMTFSSFMQTPEVEIKNNCFDLDEASRTLIQITRENIKHIKLIVEMKISERHEEEVILDEVRKLRNEINLNILRSDEIIKTKYTFKKHAFKKHAFYRESFSCKRINSTFEKCKFDNIAFESCDLRETWFLGCKFINCTFLNCDFGIETAIDYCKFKKTKFDDCSFDFIEFKKCNMKGFHIKDTDISKITLFDCSNCFKFLFNKYTKMNLECLNEADEDIRDRTILEYNIFDLYLSFLKKHDIVTQEDIKNHMSYMNNLTLIDDLFKDIDKYEKENLEDHYNELVKIIVDQGVYEVKELMNK